MSNYPCSAVILAGGQSKRLGGVNKAYFQVGKRRMLDRILEVLRPLFDEIILVTSDPGSYLEWDLLIVSDHFDQRSSLTGIHAGLFAASHPHALVAACDMPFIQPELVQMLLKAIEPKWDVIIPQTAGGLEPLLAVYSQRCLKPIQHQLTGGRYRIQGFFQQVRIKTIQENQLRRADPELASFFNINSADDLTRAKEMLGRYG